MKKVLLLVLSLLILMGCSKTEENTEPIDSEITDSGNEEASTGMPSISEAKPMGNIEVNINESEESSAGMPVIQYMPGTVEINGNKIQASGTIEGLKEIGFEATGNIEKNLAVGEISNEIELTYGDAKIFVKVINRYSESIALKYGDIIYLYVDNSNSEILDYNGFKCGTTSYDDVLKKCPYVYESTSNELIYKSNGKIIEIDIFNEKILDDSGEREIVYSFQNKILKSIEITAPQLLYYGLNDNVNRVMLDSITAEFAAKAFNVQTIVMDYLINSFINTDYEFAINAMTGEVIMDNAVLFATDQYELTSEGKAYLDEFFTNYAKAILESEAYIENIIFEGHTDDTGEYQYNLELSKKRADSVLTYCMESNNNGLSKEEKKKIKNLAMTVGYSFSDPVFDDSGNVDKDASRRVAVKFFVKVK